MIDQDADRAKTLKDIKDTQRVLKILKSSLGTDGLLIRDNEIKLLINLCEAFIEFNEDE